MLYMKKAFGVDIAKEMVDGIKGFEVQSKVGKASDGSSSEFEVLRYNALYNGYHLLLHTKKDNEDTLLTLDHKDNYLSNSETRTMYSRIRLE